jgi:hypothetical protein
VKDYWLDVNVASRVVEDVTIVPEFFDSISVERRDRAAVIATHWNTSVAAQTVIPGRCRFRREASQRGAATEQILAVRRRRLPASAESR